MAVSQDILGIVIFVIIAFIIYFLAPMVTFMAAGGSAPEYFARECAARFLVGYPTIIGMIMYYYLSMYVPRLGILIPLPYVTLSMAIYEQLYFNSLLY